MTLQDDMQTIENLLRAEALHDDPADWGGDWRDAWSSLARVRERLAKLETVADQTHCFLDALATFGGDADPSQVDAALAALDEDETTLTKPGGSTLARAGAEADDTGRPSQSPGSVSAPGVAPGYHLTDRECTRGHEFQVEELDGCPIPGCGGELVPAGDEAA